MGSNQQDWSDIDPEVPTSPWWYTTDPARMVGMRLVRSVNPLHKELIAKFWDNEIVALQDDVNACLQEGRGRDGLPVPELLKELKPK